MKKIIKVVLLSTMLLGAFSSKANILKREKEGCTEYIINLDNKVIPGTTVYKERSFITGFTLKDADIDFEKREVSFVLAKKNFIRTNFFGDARVFVSEDHPRFDQIVNLVNRDLDYIKEVCVSKEKEIISVKLLSDEE